MTIWLTSFLQGTRRTSLMFPNGWNAFLISSSVKPSSGSSDTRRIELEVKDWSFRDRIWNERKHVHTRYSDCNSTYNLYYSSYYLYGSLTDITALFILHSSNSRAGNSTFKDPYMPGVVLHTSNANTWEDEVRGLSKFKTNLGIIARYCLLKKKASCLHCQDWGSVAE